MEILRKQENVSRSLRLYVVLIGVTNRTGSFSVQLGLTENHQRKEEEVNQNQCVKIQSLCTSASMGRMCFCNRDVFV